MPDSAAARMYVNEKKKKKRSAGLIGGMKQKALSSASRAQEMGLLDSGANTYANQRQRKVKYGY